MTVCYQVAQFPVPVFSSYTIGFGDVAQRSSEACLLFHGFPADVLDPATEKNQDIAMAVASNTGIDSYVQHYKGLGRSGGDFSFTDSINDSIDFARRITAMYNYGKLHLIGHSWGAVVALNVLASLGVEQIGSVVLLSPFSEFPTRDILREVLIAVCQDVDIKFKSGGVEGALDELGEVIAKHHPRDIVRHLSPFRNRVTIIQATEDVEVPPEVTRDFVNIFTPKPVYIEFQSDHKFIVRRNELYPHVISGVKQND